MRSIAQRKMASLTAAAVLGIGLSTVGLWAVLPSLRSGGSDLQKQIDAKAAALVGQTTQRPSSARQQAAFRLALSQEDFTKASKIASDELLADREEHWAADPIKEFLESVVDYNDPAAVLHLNAWVRQAPHAPLPLLIRAQYESAIGWAIRGHAFYADTNAEDLDAFQRQMKMARADIDNAIGSGQPLPAYAYYLKLRVMQSEGTRTDKARAVQETMQKFPDYYPVFSLALENLQPKWGGDIEAMYQFVANNAEASAKDAPIRLLYLELYSDLIEIASLSCNGYKI